jgi:hypothetical protein
MDGSLPILVPGGATASRGGDLGEMKMGWGITKANHWLLGSPGQRWIWYRLGVGAIALLSLGGLGMALGLRLPTDNVGNSDDRPYAPPPPALPRADDLRQGFQRGSRALVREVSLGGFRALTGVDQRSPLPLIEGATFTQTTAGVTFVLSDGTVVPPLSPGGYSALRQTVPADQRWVLDEKFYWFLMRNPALPLIAAGLERGDYRTLLNNGVFDSDRFYTGPFLGHVLWTAEQAQVPLAELLPLVEVHLLTLEYTYFQGLDGKSSGTVYSFDQHELDLTHLQYLMRALVMVPPLEPWAKLEAIARVEAPAVKTTHTGSDHTSTTLALGRLPLPTPTAAEDTPGAHALSIAHLAERQIHLFPAEVEAAAIAYKTRYQQQLAAEDQLLADLDALAQGSTAAVLTALEHYQGNRIWQVIGFTPSLDHRSVASMDTTSLLGIYATRHESLQPLTAAQSYPLARQNYLRFFQTNSPGLRPADLLLVLFTDQALNPRLWAHLGRSPALRPQIRPIQAQVRQIEAGYRALALEEALLFRRLQGHDLDINTKAFSLLTVAKAKRLGDLVHSQFQPADRWDRAYLQFSRSLLSYLRDMPSLDAQWGHRPTIKRYGLSNYVVPDLMALSADRSPTLAAVGALWFDLVSHGQIDRWDIATLAEIMATAHNLSINYPPSALPLLQRRWLPLVAAYQPQLSRIAGVDGANAPSVLHGQTLQDFRISTWPAARTPGPPRLNSIQPGVVQQLFPQIASDRISHLIHLLSTGSGEIALAPPLMLLGNPEFIPRPNGALDLAFDSNGERLVFPEISHHFEAVYVPAYLTRIALPREPGESYAAALNQVIGRSHALYGGYLPPNMMLPAPLQRLPD